MSVFGGDDDLVIHARVDNDASPELRDVRDELRGVATQAATTGRVASASSRGFSVMGRAAKVAAFGAKVAFGAALAGGYALTQLLRSSFAEAREAQKVGATTAAIIKSTGGAAKVSARYVAGLSGWLSNMVGIDDEVIQQGANLLLTFKNVRNELGRGNLIFDRATKAAVNLSAAGFGSVDSASKMLGKALNDPLKGITALSRAGVTFSTQQTETITKLVEQGKLLAAQKIILGEVESQVGGVAKAQATWGDRASVMYANMKEQLGTALLPLLDRVSRWFVQSGGPTLENYIGLFERRGIPAISDLAATWFPRLRNAAGDAYDKVKPLATEALPVAADVFDRIKGTLEVIVPLLTDAFEGFNGLPSWAKTAIIGAGGAAVLGQKLGVWGSILKAGSAGASGLTKNRPLYVWVLNNGITTPTTTPGAPGGRGVPGVPPIVTNGFRGAFNKFGGLGLGGLLTGVTLGSRHPDGGWGTTVGKVLDDDYFEKRARRQRETLADLMGGYDLTAEKARNAGKTATAMADVTTDAFGTIYKALEPIIGSLNDVTKPRTATVRLDGAETAAARLDSLRAKLDALNNTGILTPSPGTRQPGPRSSSDELFDDLLGNGGGGRGKGRQGGRVQPRAVPNSANGWRGVSIGQVNVDARGASSQLDMDVAVASALDTYFRDREERE